MIADAAWPTPPTSAGSISFAIAGSPRKPIAERGERDPDLRGRDVLVDVLELLERDLRLPVALVGEALHPRGPRPHHRELGRDEVPVDEHEDEDEEEEDDRGHRPSPRDERLRGGRASLAPGGSAGLVLRGKSSSISGRRRKASADPGGRRPIGGAGLGGRPGPDRTPYLDALVALRRPDPGRFHVPGTRAAPAPTRGFAARSATRPSTRLPRRHRGHRRRHRPPHIPFQQAQGLAAEAWGARRSWFLVNGASGGNHAICMALAHLGAAVSSSATSIPRSSTDWC